MLTHAARRFFALAICPLTACGEPLPARVPTTPEPARLAETRPLQAPRAPGRATPPATAHQKGQPPGKRSVSKQQQPPALPSGPYLTPPLLVERAEAQRRILGDELIQSASGLFLTPAGQPPPAFRANGNTLGHFVEVENEPALDDFHLALASLVNAPRDSANKVRIAAFGASHTQADYYTGYLRYYLQQRFGNAGQGFVQMAKINEWYRHLDTKVASDGFRIEHSQLKTPPGHGRFGLAGAAAVGRYPYAFGRVRPLRRRDPARQASTYQVFYGTGTSGGTFDLLVSGVKRVALATQSDEPFAAAYEFATDLGWDAIEVKPRGDGPVRIYGVAIERDAPGVVVDTLGINGARAANMLKWDLPEFAAQLARRAPHLVTLAYGTNEATDVGQSLDIYERDLREVLERLRLVTPNASCLLIGPGDFPRRRGERWVPRPRLLDIIDAQRRIAVEKGCGFWDAYAFMGGEGSMDRWVRARPPMGSTDHIHLTPRGYVRMGMALGDALLRRFDWRGDAQLQATGPSEPN